MRRVRIPEFPLSDYAVPQLSPTGIYVGSFEQSLATRPSRAGIHRHAHFELFRLHGSGIHFNDFRDYALSGDSLVIVRPGQVHGWPESGRLRGAMLGFTREFFDGGRLPPSALFRHGFLQGRAPVVPLEASAARGIDVTLAAIALEFERRHAEWQEVARDYLHILLTQIARIDANRPGDVRGRGGELARRFQLLLEEQFRTAKSVAAYARKLGVTAGHLSDLLREQLGRGASGLIQDRILLEARRCLLHSDRSVAEIGYGLGYDDPSYFARFFRRSTGMSPAEFRAVHRKAYQRFRN